MKILSFLKNTFSNGEKANGENIFGRIIRAAYEEWKVKGSGYWSFRPNDKGVFSNRVLKLSGKQKVAFITDSVCQIARYNKGRTSWHSHDREWQLQHIRDNFLQHLLKTRLVLDEADLEAIISAFSTYSRHDGNSHITCWPVNLLVTQIEKQQPGRYDAERFRYILEMLKENVSRPADAAYEKDQQKILRKIEALLFYCDKGPDAIKPTFFPGKDDFGTYANETVARMDESDRLRWFRIMRQARKASGGKPSKKFLDESKTLFREFGTDRFKQLVNGWFVFLTAMKERTEQLVQQYDGREYVFTSTEFLAASNIDMIRGFVWMCVHFHDKSTLSHIAVLAERCFRKIPGKGPAATAIGNACLYVLAHTKGLDGIGHLSRLRLRIRHSTTQGLIEKYLHEAAAEHGVSIHEIEDMAVDSYGLEEAKKEYDLGGCRAILKITGVGKTELTWLKPDGTIQRSEPAAIKQSHAARLKRIKDTMSQVELMVTAQRDRLDRMFRCTRTIAWPQFVAFYFSHGLMCYLTDLLIWDFRHAGQQEAAFFLDGKWVNNCNEELSLAIDEDTIVSLWHPVLAPAAEVKRWQAFMIRHSIVQPMKQAFREAYLLTDAEHANPGCSTRMANHVLKQQQFNSLAKLRGWKYALMGAYDSNNAHSMATLDLPDHGLQAGFHVSEINADQATSDTGMWLYLSTGEVRFTDTASGHARELARIPPVVFSEVMRDAELFIGIASVGNDPAWPESGGLPDCRDYWQSYSFGELTEVAKTRKIILEQLVARLPISTAAELKDRFLVVKGKLRTYKIHIGSTNILMEPNDQYLCLVPDKNARNMTGNLPIPFEGDTGLALLLSKALLLANDDKITDPAITRQLQYR
ncbi:MAG: DUF4132 domain-containing protein [Chitinophagaceae bacterium]